MTNLPTDLLTSASSEAVEVEVIPAPRLSWEKWGQSFRPPRFRPYGIEVDEYVYTVNSEGDYVARDSIYVFAYPSRPTRLMPDKTWGRGTILPATVHNLTIFVSLPFVAIEDRNAALTLLVQWASVIPSVCMLTMMLKACTEEQPGTKARRPMRRTAKQIVRPLTAIEHLDQMMGLPVPSEEARKGYSFTSTSMDEALLFNQYSPVPLYSQQLIGAYAIIQARRLGVFYDMRVGKTKTLIVAALHAIKTLETADYLIMVAPKNNMYDPWVPELQTYGFDVAVLDGTYEEDEFALSHFDRNGLKPARPLALVLNYERLGLRWDLIDKYLDLERAFVGADETSAIKNPRANRSQSMHALCERASYVALLNGTPMEQGPHDLWSQLRCLDPAGVITGQHFDEWAHKFLEEVAPGKWRVSKVPHVRQEFEIMLATCSIRYLRCEADQFAGKDKNFRYVRMKPTKQMIDQLDRIEDGYVRTLNSEGETVTNEMSKCVLAIYGHLRELSCGYDKFREEEGGEYLHTRHELDPKLMWVKCWMMANPTEPLVIFCQFNEQEQALKEMLDEMHVKWSAGRPAAEKKTRQRIKASVPRSVWVEMVNKFGAQNVYGCEPDVHPDFVRVPKFLRYAPELADWVASRFYGKTEPYTICRERNFSSQEVAEQRAAFNRGDTHVYISKGISGQCKGYSVARLEAVANGIGSYPTIVFLAPPWSLGDWDQAQDRCVAVDPATGKNVCTMVYALTMPGMEEQIINALRAKKDVQATLLKDAERKGYASFAQGLIESMREAAKEQGSDLFDADDMMSRIHCGVDPTSRLTESILCNKMIERHGRAFGWKNKIDVKKWAQSQPRQAVVFSPEGSVLNPEVALREAFYYLYEQTEEWKKLSQVEAK